jgi:ACS family hexuronate transporter-like MFS transporter
MRLRWVVLGVFVLSSALNYLDRQLLPALAPELHGRFGLSNADYGLVLAAFSIAYAASAPLAGLFIDRVGLNRGVSLAFGLWSAAGIATGFVRGLGGLVACRAVLGLAQAGGVPAAG